MSPAQEPACAVVEVGRAEPLKRRHEGHPLGGGNLARHAIEGRSLRKQAQGDEPVHDGARRNHARFEAEGVAAAQAPEREWEQTGTWVYGRVSHVQVEHRRGAEGELCFAGSQCALGEGRGLLVARSGRYRERAAEQLARRLAHHRGGGHDARERPLVHREEGQDVGVPAPGPQIVEPRAGGLTRIGDVHRPAGKPEGEPRVRPPEAETTLPRSLLHGWLVAQVPLEAGGRRKRRDGDPSLGQLIRARLCALVLPAEGGAEGGPARRIPGHRRGALRDDTERRDALGAGV